MNFCTGNSQTCSDSYEKKSEHNRDINLEQGRYFISPKFFDNIEQIERYLEAVHTLMSECNLDDMIALPVCRAVGDDFIQK